MPLKCVDIGGDSTSRWDDYAVLADIHSEQRSRSGLQRASANNLIHASNLSHIAAGIGDRGCLPQLSKTSVSKPMGAKTPADSDTAQSSSQRRSADLVGRKLGPVPARSTALTSGNSRAPQCSVPGWAGWSRGLQAPETNAVELCKAVERGWVSSPRRKHLADQIAAVWALVVAADSVKQHSSSLATSPRQRGQSRFPDSRYPG